MEEKIIDTRAIYAGRVVRLDVHQVELPNGVQGRREILTHPGAVAIVALDDEQHVLLVRQFRLAANQVMLEIPAGTREPGEDIFVCAERELREETGQRPLKLEHLGGFFVAPGYTTEYIHLFLAEGYEPAPLTMDADEQISVERVPLREALAMIDDGRIIDGKSAVGLLRVARRLSLV
ncbi:MAG: NUDIX hydrolase [Anaerolineae bacterium]|nr:NUDIX hydrolase [Anaerolineae bacterium]MDW8172834.1 NUDIX hydrolase [Anaerolineae bacterium]